MAGRDISRNVREWRATHGRLIALLIRADFVEYQEFRPLTLSQGTISDDQ